MKKSFLKLLLLNCLLTTNFIINPIANKNTFAQEIQTTLNKSDNIDIKFFLHEGDIIVGKVLLNEKRNFIKASVSDNSIIATITDGQIELYELKSDTEYKNIYLHLTDSNNTTYSFELNTFKTPNKQLLTSSDVSVEYNKNSFTATVKLNDHISRKLNGIKLVEISDKSIEPVISNGIITLKNLKNDTTYSNLTLKITDNENNVVEANLNTFSTLNKDFSYANTKLFKNGDIIDVKILFPEYIEILNAKISDPSIKFEIIDNQLFLLNLKNDTNYNKLKIIIQDKSNKLHNFIINEFSTPPTKNDNLKTYIENAYLKVFNVNKLNEDSFNTLIDQLSNHKIGANEFILNLLGSDEFLETSKSSEDKITKIYEIIFKRNPDIIGLNYWINKYDEDFKNTKSNKKSIINIVKEMINSQEFKIIINDLGIRY